MRVEQRGDYFSQPGQGVRRAGNEAEEFRMVHADAVGEDGYGFLNYRFNGLWCFWQRILTEFAHCRCSQSEDWFLGDLISLLVEDSGDEWKHPNYVVIDFLDKFGVHACRCRLVIYC